MICANRRLWDPGISDTLPARGRAPWARTRTHAIPAWQSRGRCSWCRTRCIVPWPSRTRNGAMVSLAATRDVSLHAWADAHPQRAVSSDVPVPSGPRRRASSPVWETWLASSRTFTTPPSALGPKTRMPPRCAPCAARLHRSVRVAGGMSCLNVSLSSSRVRPAGTERMGARRESVPSAFGRRCRSDAWLCGWPMVPGWSRASVASPG